MVLAASKEVATKTAGVLFALNPALSPEEGETFVRVLVIRPSLIVVCLRNERQKCEDRKRNIRIFQRRANALPLLRNSFCKSLAMKDRSKTGRFFAIFGGIRAT
jgi:hypothetical protein